MTYIVYTKSQQESKIISKKNIQSSLTQSVRPVYIGPNIQKIDSKSDGVECWDPYAFDPHPQAQDVVA